MVDDIVLQSKFPAFIKINCISKGSGHRARAGDKDIGRTRLHINANREVVYYCVQVVDDAELGGNVGGQQFLHQILVENFPKVRFIGIGL